MNFRRGLALFALSGAAMTVLPIVAATPVAAASKPEVVASGLDNPEKLSFGPDGPDGPQLYIAEAGGGGPPDARPSKCAPPRGPGAGAGHADTRGGRAP